MNERGRLPYLTVADIPDTPTCFRAHMGLWAIDPLWIQHAVTALQNGLYPVVAFEEELSTQALEGNDRKMFLQTGDTAVIRLVGAMQKGTSKFGGTSTIQARRAIRQALADETVGRVMLSIDSPGGQVPGTAELADTIAEASYHKPIAAYIEDLGASAAYWAGSQAQRITSNRSAEIGSIGVLAVLEDSSGRADRAGVKVHVVSTGPYKGLGVPGSTILPEHLQEVQSRVDTIAEHFFQAVQSGRKLTKAQMAAVTDGRVHSAQQAMQLGLSDGIETFDEALAALAKMRPRRRYPISQLRSE